MGRIYDEPKSLEASEMNNHSNREIPVLDDWAFSVIMDMVNKVAIMEQVYLENCSITHECVHYIVRYTAV